MHARMTRPTFGPQRMQSKLRLDAEPQPFENVERHMSASFPRILDAIDNLAIFDRKYSLYCFRGWKNCT
jgi:hypothetical protein